MPSLAHAQKNMLTVSSKDRQRLTAPVGDRNGRQKHVWRVKIVQLSADGVGRGEIRWQTRKSQTMRCWQERFASEGVSTVAAR
jgi:hypothetical protein